MTPRRRADDAEPPLEGVEDDGVPAFDGDRVPRIIEWADDEHGRMYRSYPAWRKWKREYTKRRGWIRQRETQGRRGWERFRDMIGDLQDVRLKTMLDDPSKHFHIKALEAPREGDYSMRYNHEIRLEFTFFETDDGQVVARILDFGFHYGD